MLRNSQWLRFIFVRTILLPWSRACDPNNFPIFFQELFTLSLKLMGFFLWISTKNESFLSDIWLFLDSLFDALPRRLESTTDCSFCFGILAVVRVEGERAETYIVITHALLFVIVILTLAINGPAVIQGTWTWVCPFFATFGRTYEWNGCKTFRGISEEPLKENKIGGHLGLGRLEDYPAIIFLQQSHAFHRCGATEKVWLFGWEDVLKAG